MAKSNNLVFVKSREMKGPQWWYPGYHPKKKGGGANNLMSTASTESLVEETHFTGPVELQQVPRGLDLIQELIPPGWDQVSWTSL